MEKSRISTFQLFALMLLFEHGSALLFPLGSGVKQDAWIAILLGMLGSLVLFYIFYLVSISSPGNLPTTIIQEIYGKFIGKFVSVLYSLYFAYIASRVLRDFGEMLISFAYPNTPMIVLSTLMMLVIIYTIRQGIEVFSRAGEVMFLFMIVFAACGLFLIFFSKLVDLRNLLPIMEKGFVPILKEVGTQTLYIPFGEAVVFAMILPYVRNEKKGRNAGLLALFVSGVSLALVNALNVSVTGVDLYLRSQFPLLSTVQSIQFAGFLERLDIGFMILLIVGGFFKITVFVYATVIGLADTFKVKKPGKLVLPIGIGILLLSMIIAENFDQHLEIGLKVVPIYIHLPFQVIFPIITLLIMWGKKWLKHKKSVGSG